jgi:hypothetical protein
MRKKGFRPASQSVNTATLNWGSMAPPGGRRGISNKTKLLASAENISIAILIVMTS